MAKGILEHRGDLEKKEEEKNRSETATRNRELLAQNKTPRTRFESPRRLLISPPPSAAQEHSNVEPNPGKWLPRAVYGTNVVGLERQMQVIEKQGSTRSTPAARTLPRDRYVGA